MPLPDIIVFAYFTQTYKTTVIKETKYGPLTEVSVIDYNEDGSDIERPPVEPGALPKQEGWGSFLKKHLPFIFGSETVAPQPIPSSRQLLTGGAGYDMFANMTSKNRGRYFFAYTFNPEVLTAPFFGERSPPRNDTVWIIQAPRYFSQHERMVVTSPITDYVTSFGGDQQLMTWIATKDLPLVGEQLPGIEYRWARRLLKFDPETFQKRYLPLVVVYFDVSYESQEESQYSQAVAEALRIFAKEFEGRALVAIGNKDTYAEEIKRFRDVPHENFVVTAQNRLKEKWAFTDLVGQHMPIDFKATLGPWLERVVSGEEPRILRSAPLPLKTRGGSAVREVVASNFLEVVMDRSKNVLLEFYAPWCGHCKNLAPVYEDVAKRLDGIASLSVVKMDATANDVLGPYEVQGYPSVFLAPAHKKDAPIRFNMPDQSVKSFIDFVKEHSAHDYSSISHLEHPMPFAKEEL